VRHPRPGVFGGCGEGEVEGIVLPQRGNCSDQALTINLHCLMADSSHLLPARHLDLHELHRVFTNGKFGRQIDYLEYLGSLANFAAIPKHERLKAPYRWALVLYQAQQITSTSNCRYFLR